MLFIFILSGVVTFACCCVGLGKLLDALEALRHCRYRNLSEQYKHQLKIGACLTYLPLLLFLLFCAVHFSVF